MWSVAEWEWNPETYLAEMAEEIPGYDDLQKAVAAATADVHAARVLELGTGTGETALLVRALQPEAHWVGIDSSEAMLTRARERLSDADLRLLRLEDELPAGPFDLVVSALALHHLDGEGKQGLFCRVARVMAPGGHFVLGDVVVPPAGQEGPIYIDWVMDTPDTVENQLAWLRSAGFEAEADNVRIDLAVFRATLIAP
jgi:tRNA (cmo5U34)-methyltransferase